MRARWLAFLLVFITACSTPQTQSAPATTSPTPMPTSVDRFEVKAWVNEPNPKLGQVLVLSGSLIKNGVYLNGLMMSGFWQETDEETPSQHCYEFVNYQRGKCNIIVEGFTEGEFVPLKIKIIYQGMSFTAETGFTPSGK